MKKMLLKKQAVILLRSKWFTIKQIATIVSRSDRWVKSVLADARLQFEDSEDFEVSTRVVVALLESDD